jgi:hypothetical protein
MGFMVVGKFAFPSLKTTTDVANGLERVKWLVKALITFAIVQTTHSTEVVSCQTMREES